MLNVAIIGCGYWGPNLLRNFNALDDCRIAAVCDMDTNRLEHMARLYPDIETSSDSDELLARSDIGAVAVATPTGLHYQMARKALESRKHVLVEKPMATSVAECEDLIEIAQTANLVLMVGHTFIYSPAVRKIKEIIDQGDLGQIHYVGARRLNLGLLQKDINVAWDLAPHDISILLYVLGQMPIAVNCQGKAHVAPGIEDVTNMTLTFTNGLFATIQSSWLDPNKIRDMTFVGERKMLVYNDMEPLEKIKIYDKRVERPAHYDTFGDFQYSYHYGDVYSPYVKQAESLKFECQDFVDCIRMGKTPQSHASVGLMVVQVLEAASESLRNGGGRALLRLPFVSESPPRTEDTDDIKLAHT